MSTRARWRSSATVVLSAAGVLLGGVVPLDAQESVPAQPDPRAALRPGWDDAGTAARHMEHLATRRPGDGFYDPTQLGNILLANSDIAFRGDLAFMGSFHGFNIYDISTPSDPRLRVSVICPGGQGDLSVHGDLLFMSVEMPNGRIDCGTEGELSAIPDAERFVGVRIFDISNVDSPAQVAAVQTCRGSHTHTLVPDPADPGVIYVYVSGTSMVRSAEELAGCSGLPPDEDPNTAYFRIEVIRVPVGAPHEARIVSSPRIFADEETGDIRGLWRGGRHGPGTQNSATTDQCHDITAYPAIGLAAGACAGNGILLDISEPANPRRVDEVVDPNFAYWHSATFNHDGTKVIFTDEWGGGLAARCRETDPPNWGANAIFDVVEGELRLAGYYKLPVAQTAQENCVAHNGSLVPVPGRDIKVQAWYQGGISVFDFTDSANPVEIAFFDRGPYSETDLLLGGFWSAYWYNGHVYGSEMGRGLDVLRLLPSEHLSKNEIDAANLVRFEQLNVQSQPHIVWPPAFVVARAYIDQLRRSGGVSADRVAEITAELARIESVGDAAARRSALMSLAATTGQLGQAASGADARRLVLLTETLQQLGDVPQR
jgi:hypothetical protein